MAPDLTQILLAVFGEQSGKTAFLKERMRIVFRSKFFNLPVIDIISVPGLSVTTHVYPGGTACSCSPRVPNRAPRQQTWMDTTLCEIIQITNNNGYAADPRRRPCRLGTQRQ